MAMSAVAKREKHMMRTTSFSSWLTAALVALGLTAAGVALAGPVGSLDIQGNVRIAQPGSEVFFRMSNTRYPWFPGDRIDTGGGTAIMDLDGGVNIGFARETRAALTVEAAVVRVELESGALLYAIPQSRMDLVITSGEDVLSTRADAEYLRVSASGPGSFGIVQRLDNGQLRVTVRDGMMVVGDKAGNVHHRVAANQRVVFSGDGSGLLIAQIEAITPPPEPEPEVVAEPAPPAEPPPGEMNPLMVGGLALGALAVIGAAGGGGGGGGGPPRPPASP
jgi:hypothetical protein